MSNFIKKTKNPWTGEWEEAQWLDDYFGHHKYGVRFSDGYVADPEKEPLVTEEQQDEQ